MLNFSTIKGDYYMAVGSRFVMVGPQQGNFETTPILGHEHLKARRAGGAIAPWPMALLKKWWGHCPLALVLPMAMYNY
jgi:hypothetical protein